MKKISRRSFLQVCGITAATAALTACGGTKTETAKKDATHEAITFIFASWGAVPDRAIATEIDKSTYEVKMSRGLQVNRAEKMFILRCSL